jgi:hypothetical protein
MSHAITTSVSPQTIKARQATVLCITSACYIKRVISFISEIVLAFRTNMFWLSYALFIVSFRRGHHKRFSLRHSGALHRIVYSFPLLAYQPSNASFVTTIMITHTAVSFNFA